MSLPTKNKIASIEDTHKRVLDRCIIPNTRRVTQEASLLLKSIITYSVAYRSRLESYVRLKTHAYPDDLEERIFRLVGALSLETGAKFTVSFSNPYDGCVLLLGPDGLGDDYSRRGWGLIHYK